MSRTSEAAAAGYFPWGVASAMEQADAPQEAPLFAYGLMGGLLAFAAMTASLARREMR